MVLQREKQQEALVLESNPKYLGFKSLEVVEVDETKPWKPAKTVKVTLANGKEEVIDANTAFFTFVDKDLKNVVVTAAVAGHIKELHIDGKDAGSLFSEHHSLEELMLDVESKLPEDLAVKSGVQAFSVEMNKPMGKEGLASMQELLAAKQIEESDWKIIEAVRSEVYELNRAGTDEARQAFVEDFKSKNLACKIQFQVVRGKVLVPVFKGQKQDTTKLFMVFGPDANGEKSMYTAAPGRNMPRHPNPAQFGSEEPKEAFEESLKAWFETAMLIQ